MAIKKRNDEELIDNLIALISDIYQEANSKVLSIITERIKHIGQLTPTDAARLSILLKNQDLKQIESILSEATSFSIKQIDSIVTESAAYNDDLSDELFKAKNMAPATFSTDLSLLTIVEQAKKNMIDDVVRLSNTTAFVVNGKVTDIGKTYNYAVNRAVFEVQQGLFDFNTAMRSTVKELADSGIRTVEYDTIMPNGKPLTKRLDSAARMNISDGVRQLNANYRETQGKRFGTDGIELSAHGLCSPEHLPYQGKQYTNEEFERIQSSLKRPFFTMNCKHSQFPIIIGISDPAYSDKELMEIEQKSNEIVKYQLPGGKVVEKPRYEAVQDQRRQETKIRRLKDNKAQFEIMNDKVEVSNLNRKIKEQTAAYKTMSDQMGVSAKMERTRVVK